MTERGAGSDSAVIQTLAVKGGEDFLVNGAKTFISDGSEADIAVFEEKMT